MRTFSAVLLYCLTSALHAQELMKVEYLRNVDGDTIIVNLSALKNLDRDGDFSIFWENAAIRLSGIDTPEIRGACPEEIALAEKAKTATDGFLRRARTIGLANLKKDKYFRINAEIIADGVPLSRFILRKGYGVPYDGGRRTHSWCQDQSIQEDDMGDDSMCAVDW